MFFFFPLPPKITGISRLFILTKEVTQFLCDLLLKILVIRMMDFEQVTTAVMVQPAITLQGYALRVTINLIN